MLKLTLRNVLRHPLRAALTVVGMALAILAFALLRTMVEAWYAGVDASSPVRLVTRNAVSLMANLPLAYEAKIRALPGVTGVGHAYWFEGVYVDKKHFFPQFAISLPGYYDLMPELLIPDETMLLFHWDYLNEQMKKLAPDRADKVGWFLVQIASPDLAGEVSAQIDALFKNSLAETLPETAKD